MKRIMMKMKNNFFLIKEINEETVTDSGIIIPADKYERRAKVYAVCEDEDVVNVGDTVIKNVGRGTPIVLNGEEYEMLHKDFIMAVLVENNMNDE